MLNFPKGGGPGPKSTRVEGTLWYWPEKPNILVIPAEMRFYILAWDKQISDICKPPQNKESFCYSQVNPLDLAQCLVQREHIANTYLIDNMVSEVWTVSPGQMKAACLVKQEVTVDEVTLGANIAGNNKWGAQPGNRQASTHWRCDGPGLDLFAQTGFLFSNPLYPILSILGA